MPARTFAAGAAILRVIVGGAVVAYFGYMTSKIASSLGRIAATLEQIRVDRATL
jgi:hypothetical protein